jgi:D-aminopeptidase
MIAIYISIDFEGIAGISHAKHAFPTQAHDYAGYHVALKQLKYTIEQLFSALSDETPHRILINDAHASMTNLFLAEVKLPPYVNLISGKPKKFGMMAGLDDSFDACVLIGYHAKAGTLNAPLAHTFTDDVADIQLNGISLGEAGLSILLAELGYGVPVLLTYGDNTLAEELESLKTIGVFQSSSQYITSKIGRGWQCVQSVPKSETSLAQSFQSIFKISEPSLLKPIFKTPQLLVETPLEVVIQFHHPLQADACQLLPFSERLDGVRVKLPLCFSEETAFPSRIQTIYQSIQCAYSLASYAKLC